MNSFERVLTTLGFQEPDRVPWLNLVSMHGALELGMSIEDYFSKGSNVAEGQFLMQKEYGHDCYYNFFYTPLEMEAMGSKPIFRENGPPNAGAPIIKTIADIDRLKLPDPLSSPILERVYQSSEILSKASGGEIPIIGVVVSPFSLPVMQMGFEGYLELLWEQGEAFWQLMEKNIAFCIDWANAQLKHGANAICYFDPVSSDTVVPLDIYLKTGFKIAKKTISQINGPTATHFASGNCSHLLPHLPETGTAMAGVSSLEDLTKLKSLSYGKVSLLGNLNGIAMARWTPEQAKEIVKNVILTAGKGGGFLLADNHGEIPIQVPKETLKAIGEAVRAYGQYPLE